MVELGHRGAFCLAILQIIEKTSRYEKTQKYSQKGDGAVYREL